MSSKNTIFEIRAKETFSYKPENLPRLLCDSLISKHFAKNHPMKKTGSIIFCFVLTSVCLAQVADNFTDGDFTNSPTWSGSTSKFIVNASKVLQLNNSVAGT